MTLSKPGERTSDHTMAKTKRGVGEHTVRMHVECGLCGDDNVILIPRAMWDRYLIEDEPPEVAFADLNSNDKRFMLQNICNTCWLKQTKEGFAI